MKAYAVQNSATRGRKHEECLDTNRDPFQLDRDRILHSRAWRRMDGKTQVFVVHYGDHYRTRMTHSLEVAQIARDLARDLGLNEDLAETIGLAHDLGHTPFGHAGEFALHECMRAHGLEFEHNAQSLRVVTELEEVYPGFKGLNLSIEVLEGLMKHHTSWDNPHGGEAVKPSLEAQVVNLADEIAYQNHDVDDGLRSGLLNEADLEQVELWRMAQVEVAKQYGPIENAKIRCSRTVSKMTGLMIHNVYKESSHRLKKAGIETLEDVYSTQEPLVGFAEGFVDLNRQLKEFLMTRLYHHPQVVELSEQGQQVVTRLFAHYLEQGLEPEQVRDYLAGMTDHFALQQALELR